MSENQNLKEKKSSRLKWLLPIGLFVVFLAGVLFTRNRGAMSLKEIPNLSPLEQNQKTEMAPEFEMSDLDGKKLRLRDFRGKAVLINFWSLSCPACLMELKSLESLAEQLNGKPFALIALTDDSRDDIKRFLAESQLKLPVYFDLGNVAHSKYGVYYLPASFVIDPEGRLVDQVPGAADWSDPQVITYFQKLIELSRNKPTQSP